MTTYERIVFMQGDDYDEFQHEVESILLHGDASWEEVAIEYLSQWDNGDGGDGGYAEPSRGTEDSYAQRGDYVLTWNQRLGYVGLERIETP